MKNDSIKKKLPAVFKNLTVKLIPNFVGMKEIPFFFHLFFALNSSTSFNLLSNSLCWYNYYLLNELDELKNVYFSRNQEKKLDSKFL